MTLRQPPKIQIYIVYDKPFLKNLLPCSNVLVPIVSSRTDGINIANRPEYCELRAHYFVWKNMKFNANDYVGLFHYRRYLDFSYPIVPINAQRHCLRPYKISAGPNVNSYKAEILCEKLNGYDLIAPLPEYTGIPVWERYISKADHYLEELILVQNILAQKYPDYLIAFDRYINGNTEYYCNMFVMKWNDYQEYCKWLFDVLHEVGQHLSKSRVNHTMGYLGERLFGIYLTKLKEDKSHQCGEIPRIHFWRYDDDYHHFYRDSYINLILPPGSRRRVLMKKLILKERYKKDEFKSHFDHCNPDI